MNISYHKHTTALSVLFFTITTIRCSSPIMVYNEASEPVSIAVLPQLKEEICLARDIPGTMIGPIAPYTHQPISTNLDLPAHTIVFKIGTSTHMALIGNITAQCEIIIATRQGIPSVGIRKTPSGPYASLRVAIFNKPLKRNEDRWIIDNHNTRYDFFGIFDGHCGSQVAEYLQKRTVNTILRNIELGHKMKRALIEAFTQIETRICLHQELLKLFGSQRQAATGSCALLVAVDKKKRIVYTANVGDSRAVLVQDNTERPLTHDHKPDSPSEMARILQAGGSVLEARDLPYCRKHQGVTKQPARYEGILAVSRTLGDYVIKLRHPGAIIAQPDIYIHPIQQHDQAIILACDGVWDVIDNATAAAHVREHTGDPLGASQALVLHAAQRGSRDDLTSIVITIEHNQ